MSIDETNRIRISLGLEPLAAPDSAVKAQKKEDSKAKQEEARKAKEDDEIRKDIQRRRRERSLKSKTEGATLGEQLADTTGGSAADWVKRSRKLGKTKAAAGLRAALLAEQEEAAAAEAGSEYDSKDLKGLKVRHGLDEFEKGKTVIMTLKDTHILSGENTEIHENDEADMLENVNMVDTETLNKNLEIKSQKKIYDATGEEADTLLPQYNDEAEKQGLTLEGDEDARLASIRSKLKKAAAEPVVDKRDQFKQGKTEYNLEFHTGVGSDYLPKQPATFKKRRKKVKKTGDGRKKKEKFVLPEPSAEERSKDHASRGASRKDQLDAERNNAAKVTRDQSYLKALQKAELDSKRMLDELEDVFEDEEDAALQSSLDRARRLKKDKKGKKGLKKEDEDYKDPIKLLAERLLKIKEEKQDEVEEDEAMEPVEKKEGDDATVFTATTEFCRGLQDTVDREKDKQDEQQKFGFQAVEMDKGEKDKKDKKKMKERDFDPETEERNEDDESDEDDDSEDEEFYNNEPLANSGASSALELMRIRGLLKQKIAQVGRANDGQLELEDAGSNISIVHLDEHGRPMKPKEAFRKLSHKFHGRGPSAQKQEKNLKKLREEVRRKQNLSRNKSLTMNKLKKHQNQFKTAHVVLEGEGATQAAPRGKKKAKGGFKKPEAPKDHSLKRKRGGQ